MYLHLGQDVVVKLRDIVGIFDIDNTTSKHTNAFLSRAEREGQVINVSLELPKSFALCVENGKQKVYISQISAATLLKRCQSAYDLSTE